MGASGRVTATDIDTRFLHEIDEANLEVVLHDITTQDPPSAKFDLVHTRWLLHHLPQPERVVEWMVASLRPGGGLVLEEVEFFHWTGEQMRHKIIAAGTKSAERFDTPLALLGGPKFWALAAAGIAVWGRRAVLGVSHFC